MTYKPERECDDRRVRGVVAAIATAGSLGLLVLGAPAASAATPHVLNLPNVATIHVTLAPQTPTISAQLLGSVNALTPVTGLDGSSISATLNQQINGLATINASAGLGIDASLGLPPNAVLGSTLAILDDILGLVADEDSPPPPPPSD